MRDKNKNIKEVCYTSKVNFSNQLHNAVTVGELLSVCEIECTPHRLS